MKQQAETTYPLVIANHLKYQTTQQSGSTNSKPPTLPSQDPSENLLEHYLELCQVSNTGRVLAVLSSPPYKSQSTLHVRTIDYVYLTGRVLAVLSSPPYKSQSTLHVRTN